MNTAQKAIILLKMQEKIIHTSIVFKHKPTAENEYNLKQAVDKYEEDMAVYHKKFNKPKKVASGLVDKDGKEITHEDTGHE